MDIIQIKDQCRLNLAEFTKKAFQLIPEIDKPKIIDIGCGTGISCLELSDITNGSFIAIDIDKMSINLFKKKLEKTEKSNRISVIHDSIFNVGFEKESVDIIIAEGILHIVGFKRSIKHFTPFIRTGGYFIIHDEVKEQERKLKTLKKNNLRVLKTIVLDNETWKKKYVDCLKSSLDHIEASEMRNTNNEIYKNLKSEINLYYENPSMYQSIIYVIEKTK